MPDSLKPPALINHRHLVDVAHAYALDLISIDEQHRIEQQLLTFDTSKAAEFRRIVHEARETMGRLAVLNALPPPAALESRILVALDSPSERSVIATVAALERTRRRDMRRIGWATTAAAATAVAFGISVGIANQQTNHAPPTAVTAEQVQRQPDSQMTSSISRSGGVVIMHYSIELGFATVAFDSSTPSSAGYDLQIWLIGADGVPRSGGVLSAMPTTSAPYLAVITGSDRVAFTVEPDGGSPAPTTTPIAELALDRSA
ncbi:anti-sigma factor domain-containing protein [Nocardia sp. NPDC059180]|uniref:anti-sigma factor n=1 Tax=Nocardia sp. NPDC059180 TaxID=3346761 RepID=UPI0036AD3DB4